MGDRRTCQVRVVWVYRIHIRASWTWLSVVGGWCRLGGVDACLNAGSRCRRQRSGRLSECERCTLLLQPDVSKRPSSIWRCAWLRLIVTSLGPIIIKLETRRIVEGLGRCWSRVKSPYHKSDQIEGPPLSMALYNKTRLELPRPSIRQVEGVPGRQRKATPLSWRRKAKLNLVEMKGNRGC
jgi:hypothetical protein